MLGNDVVDLGDPETLRGAQHPRFDARVFTREERAAIADSPAPERLRWSLWPALAAAAGIALTAWLGMWQYGRGQEKSALAARIEKLAQEPPITVTARELDVRDVELRQVEARGTFEPRYAVFVDNRVRRGIVGYHVVMPLKLEQGARYVLVNRGWIAAGPDRSRLPEVKTPPGPIVVRGRAVVPTISPQSAIASCSVVNTRARDSRSAAPEARAVASACG